MTKTLVATPDPEPIQPILMVGMTMTSNWSITWVQSYSDAWPQPGARTQ